MLQYCLIILLVMLCMNNLVAQKKNAAYRYTMHKIHTPIKIDGVMDEPAWQQAQVANNFFMVLPMDTSLAHVKTEVRMVYDNHNIYISAICFSKEKGPNMVESLHRDFNFQKNDNFILFLDPFDDQTNGFTFGANAEGAQWDGSMYEGGRVDLNWDNKWISAVKNYKGRWIFEAAIPFKSIRYKNGIKEWGINFSRNDLKAAEKSSWTPIPRQFPTASLAYTGILELDSAAPLYKKNISIIPYTLTNWQKDYTNNNSGALSQHFGLDAKISVTPALNLDLTIHPDFSQVEVDQQVTNLSRFELFFPEKRQFFLENSDLFGDFGFSAIQPFFSRRIGLDALINAGARLSGKLNKDWRIGAMDMETQQLPGVYLPNQNFAVVSLQRRVFQRSSIGVMYVDKTAINYHPGNDTTKPIYSLYNRNFGLQYNLASPNNVWTGKAFVLKSFSPGKSGDDISNAAILTYNSRKWNVIGEYEFVGKNYTAETGYVPRTGYVRFNPQIIRYFFPKGGNILSHGPQFNLSYYFDEKMHQTDYENSFLYLITFRNRLSIDVYAAHDYVELLQPFDPTNTGKDSLAIGSIHKWSTVGFDINSQPQKLFTYAFSVRYGGYYASGTHFAINSTIGYRFQPYVNMNMNFSYNYLQLPAPWGNTPFYLVGPRIDVTFTNNLYFTTYVQYNNQLKNLNINSRLQWRYKPASDLFLVYTDNYFPAPFMVKNRELALKFNYWWNL
ncbi:DUF5916 domain-containing protein [Hydrotalea sp.]|uniref:carbohydrate binding family 9 domain-containing protein n=3 Tax=Pseudomonadati TaxID=3379134 RepID=UPI002612694E|nr:DUF5916 domain-containing protein [Hydrotalea sp.]